MGLQPGGLISGGGGGGYNGICSVDGNSAGVSLVKCHLEFS